jgi:hypothetical protein
VPERGSAVCISVMMPPEEFGGDKKLATGMSSALNAGL